MHPSVCEWVTEVLTTKMLAGAHVLEVGSCDVNGSVRPLLADHCDLYVGVDATDGPRVDVICECEHLCETMGRESWDIVISTEMLEHVADWRACVLQLVGALKPGGLLVLTTRSPGFPYHPFPIDCWRFTRADIAGICDAVGLDPLKLIDDTDRHTPGVFLLARKPHKPRFIIGGLAAIHPQEVHHG